MLLPILTTYQQLLYKVFDFLTERTTYVALKKKGQGIQIQVKNIMVEDTKYY